MLNTNVSCLTEMWFHPVCMRSFAHRCSTKMSPPTMNFQIERCSNIGFYSACMISFARSFLKEMWPSDNFGIGFWIKMLLPSCLHHSIHSRMFDKHVSPTWNCGIFVSPKCGVNLFVWFHLPTKLAQQEAGMVDIPQVPICPERQTRNAAKGINIKQVGDFFFLTMLAC